jgi:putative addiction module component (TIGR02574 family)
MTLPFTKEDLKRFSVDERQTMLQLICESLEEEQGPFELTDAQRAELDRRLVDIEQNPDDEQPWEIVLADIQRRFKA